MTDEPENLTLIYLKRMATLIERLVEDTREVKLRLTSLEIIAGNLVATEMSHYAIGSERMDRLNNRIERIDARLDLREA